MRECPNSPHEDVADERQDLDDQLSADGDE